MDSVSGLYLHFKLIILANVNSNPYQWLQSSLNTIVQANWHRVPKILENCPGPVIQYEGKKLINFASNDYLGLAGDERLNQAAIEAVRSHGTGSTGSRLLSGSRELHRELEGAIAELKQTEDSIVFSSGYLANLGTISALVGKRDLVLSDQYNHSSLKNGARLSSATIIDYRHCDIADLRMKLSSHRQKYRRCLIVSDGIFSMDGDICPLPDLIAIAQTFDSMLLVDDAHATGILGETGTGVAEHFGCAQEELIQIGTLSKAIGSLGGYVAGSAKLIDFLRNRAATWIYTTALSPADTAAALTAIKLIQTEPQHRQQLWCNIDWFREQLTNRSVLPTDSAIFCLPLKDASNALIIAQKLMENGIFAPAIRPPTVPISRIRFSLMASHQKHHLEQLVNVLNLV